MVLLWSFASFAGGISPNDMTTARKLAVSIDGSFLEDDMQPREPSFMEKELIKDLRKCTETRGNLLEALEKIKNGFYSPYNMRFIALQAIEAANAP